MNKQAYAYVTSITVAATVILIMQDWAAFDMLSAADWIGIAAFVGLSIFSEAIAIKFTVGPNKAVNSSIAFLPLFACAILFPPTIAIGAAASAELITQLAFRGKKSGWIMCFNVSLAVITVAAATTVAVLIAGPISTTFHINFPAFAGLATTFFVVNVLLISALFSIRQGHRYSQVLSRMIGPHGGNIWYGILASPMAVLVAFLYDRLYVGGMILVIFPLLLIRYSYLSKVQLQQANEDLLKVLIKTIETRDPYTSGHSLRVSRIARAIANDLGLPRRKAEQVETAALLHDVGKIDTVYASIIQKPHALTEEENRIIKTHATKGAELLANLTSMPDEVIRGVRHHHERFDGNGYPDGLKGTNVPLAARIIMLCDSIDAMLSDRPYRRALSIEQARDELDRCSGSQFDPVIVEAVLNGTTLELAVSLINADSAADERVEPTWQHA